MFGDQLQGVAPRSWLAGIDCPVPVWILPSGSSDVKGRRHFVNHADSIFVFCSLIDDSEEEANMSSPFSGHERPKLGSRGQPRRRGVILALGSVFAAGGFRGDSSSSGMVPYAIKFSSFR